MTALLAPASSQAGNSAAERRHALEDAHASAQAQGVALRRTLLPMAIPPQIRRLILVKDGAILGLSFASLPYSQGSYLGEHFQIASEPSVTMAFRATRKHAPGAKMLAVVFADPSAFDASQAQPPSGRNERPGLEQVSLVASLPFARQEAHLIAEVLGERNTTVFSGASASRAQALRLDWSAFNIAHFATHAIYRDNHLELSGLLLSSDPASPKSAHAPLSSSILSFSDVLRMRAHLQLAVLSACNSDVGKFIPGEGMLALDNAFLAAGTSTVIGTLWPVDDEASSVFMAHFYHALAGNRSPIQSLKEAQRAMAASTEWSAPYYWGAFSLSGDWHPFPN